MPMPPLRGGTSDHPDPRDPLPLSASSRRRGWAGLRNACWLAALESQKVGRGGDRHRPVSPG